MTFKVKLSEIPANVAIFFVQMYRKAISPLFGGGKCRFYPTCSEYAVLAFNEYGFCVGFLLAARRVLRCAPWCKGGYDPLPDREELKRIWIGRLFFTSKG